MAKVFLSAGHGGKDPGAIGNGLEEKNINLQTMKACKAFLEANGVVVVASRMQDENDPVAEEVREANASRADVAVSFHTNAGGGDGSENYYYSKDPKGKRLAELIEKHTKAIGQNSRGNKIGDGLRFINSTNMTAVLNECAFIDSRDIAIVDETNEQITYGIACAKAILEYLGLSIQPMPIPTPTPYPEPSNGSFLIRVKTNLNIRKGPGVEYQVVGQINDRLKYTIVETAAAKDGGTWGKLKSGAGWINISPAYVDRV